MGYQSSTIKYEALKSVDSATFAGSYVALGTPTAHEARILKIVNASNVAVTFSTDGSTDMDVLTAGASTIYYLGTERGNPSPTSVLPKGTQFYAKGAAGVGLVYVVVMYGDTPSQTIPL